MPSFAQEGCESVAVRTRGERCLLASVMVESDFWEHWDRLLFRDYLIANPGVAAEYGELKARLAKAHPHDRKAYTGGKTEFIHRVTEDARGFFECGKNSLRAAQVSL